MRDQRLRVGVRQVNWLRREHLRRVLYVMLRWRSVVAKVLSRDAGMSPLARVQGALGGAMLPRQARLTQHKTRCRVSGRSRQVCRRTLLARMHYRAALYDGLLPGVFLQRT
jgi:ribosomal protein S14